MCGIGAVASLRGERGRTEATIAGMIDVLHHRGPDDRASLLDEPVSLAFTRLSLVAPENGSQPLVSDDGDYVLVANGEVYNHRELEARLPAGVRMRTASDCEVLLYLYREYGEKFLDDVRGMFALILWDRRKGRLVLARDRFGIKPLFYHHDAERLIAGSEIKSLFTDPRTPRQFDWHAALRSPYLQAAASFDEGQPCTWFADIRVVTPGTILTLELATGTTSTTTYWTPPSDIEPDLSAEDFVVRYRELLESSVRDCATSDTELGLFLSGGIDSVSVLALAAPQLGELHTFSAWTPGTLANGDVAAAAAAAARYGASHHEVIFDDSPPDPQVWRRLLWLTETPQCGPEVYYKNELHRYARSVRPQLRGMLLGAASDEFNGGYSAEIGRGSWDGFGAALEEMSLATDLAREPVLRAWANDPLGVVRAEALAAAPGSQTDPYTRYVHSERRKVHQYNVWHEDRTAAGSGIEARVPFLDHRLVELSMRVPHRLRGELLFDKQILRRAVWGIVAEEFAQRPKVPFFYGSGTRQSYRFIRRMLAQNDFELVERAVCAPGASEVLAGDAVRAASRRVAASDDARPEVEILLGVINMGLLAELVSECPRFESMDGGPVRASLAQHSPAGTESVHDSLYGNLEVTLGLSADVMIVTDVKSQVDYLVAGGEIRYGFEPGSRVLALLKALDGLTPLANVLASVGLWPADLDGDLGQQLAQLLDEGLVHPGRQS